MENQDLKEIRYAILMLNINSLLIVVLHLKVVYINNRLCFHREHKVMKGTPETKGIL